MLRKLLIGSATMNVVLLAVITYFAFEPARKADPAVAMAVPVKTSAAPASIPVPAPAPREVIAAYELAKKSGLPSEMAERFLAAGLVEAFTQSAPAEEYWAPPRERALHRAQQQFDLEEKVRGAALQVMGPAAIERPAFRTFFYPLGPQFAFLSSDKQIGIRKARLAAQENAQGPGFADQPSKLEGLTEDEAFQYSLRDSRMAQMLTASGFAFTEKEFLAVFKVLWDAGSSGTRWTPMMNVGFSSPENNVIQSQIRTVLGDTRFREFRRFQDPTYRLLTAVARARGLTEQTAQQAYDVIDQSNEQITQIRLQGPLLKGGQIKAIEEAQAHRDEDLRKILGEQGLAEVSRALAMQRAPLGLPFKENIRR